MIQIFEQKINHKSFIKIFAQLNVDLRTPISEKFLKNFGNVIFDCKVAVLLSLKIRYLCQTDTLHISFLAN